MNNKRLILGTVQLGMPYGIANANGQPSSSMAFSMVKTVLENGMYKFDTAFSYGESETVLGQIISDLGVGSEIEVITKLPVNLSSYLPSEVVGIIEGSLKRLHVERLHCVMLHNENDLNSFEKDYLPELVKLKKAGIIKFLGCSVYSASNAERALKMRDISIVQLPGNIFDRRMGNAGIFSLATSLGKQIHLRSVLLQGVLCFDLPSLPYFLSALKPVLEHFRALCNHYSLNVAPAAIAWAMRYWQNADVIFGAENIDQVQDNLQACEYLSQLEEEQWSQFDMIKAPQAEMLYTPYLWETNSYKPLIERD